MENIISNKMESSFITVPKNFRPRLTYFVAKAWCEHDEIENWKGSGVEILKLMNKDCGVTLQELKKAISRRGLSAKIVKSHSYNGDEQSIDWSDHKEWRPVYKIGNEYYVYAYDKAQFGGCGLVFQQVDHWAEDERDLLEYYH